MGFSFRMVGRTFILQEIRQARAIFYACLILSSTTGSYYIWAQCEFRWAPIGTGCDGTFSISSWY
ncbi:hypothetical protein B1691_15175 [Geobacillus sp. 47C-IIb]|nr:hypothetical protein B1691_15175 [Geobacillus sp. 47C-IIb]